jgi:hypothetical protein
VKILDLDVECRPMAWYAGDMVTKEITAIAWRFVHEKESRTRVWLLEPSKTWAEHLRKRKAGLKAVLEDYNAADMVTGHYLRGFDLPLLNAACFRLGLPILPQKLAEDTKSDLVKMSGLSKAQQNLAATLDAKKGVSHHLKEQMDTHLWEVANSLVEEGRKEAKRRVVGDVNQHIGFRNDLIESGALCRPRVWYPAPNGASAPYVG